MRSAGEEDMVQEACTGWAQGRLSDPRAALRTAHMLRRPSTPGGAFIKVPCETLAPCVKRPPLCQFLGFLRWLRQQLRPAGRFCGEWHCLPTALTR